MRVVEDLLDSADVSADEPHFDSVRMKRRSGEDVFDDTSSQLASCLICFQDDVHFDAASDVLSMLTVHTRLKVNTILRIRLNCWTPAT